MSTILKGTLKVERGATLSASRVRVNGNVQSEGHRSVRLLDSRVGGSIQLVQGGTFDVRRNIVNGDVQASRRAPGCISTACSRNRASHRWMTSSQPPPPPTGGTTLTGKGEPMRITVDTDLVCTSGGRVVRALHDRVLLEVKTPTGRDPVLRVLRRMGVRPVSVSKYCAGVALLHPELPHAPWAGTLRRHFGPAA